MYIATPTRRPHAYITLAATLTLATAFTTITGCATTSKPADANAVATPKHTATSAEAAAARSPDAITSDRVVLYVNGLSCPQCATNVDDQLKRVRGVQSVQTDLSNGRVTLELTPGKPHPSPATLAEAVEDAGFTLVKVESL
jgi:copper chaperone CopZ